jgi:dihydropteroate synthase
MDSGIRTRLAAEVNRRARTAGERLGQVLDDPHVRNLHAGVRRPRKLRVEMRRPIEERFPRPSVMGVVNVTPDSFSDGGVNFRPEDAVASALRMLAEGAAIVDVGGESTRPGSEGVSLEEELRRVVPVLEQLDGAPVSIDTSKAQVARRALDLGAELVNDVTALRGDPELAGVVADSDAYLCLMHMRGEPRTMQLDPRYEDVAAEVAAFLEERLGVAVAAGVLEQRICLDPGIGFGKTVEQNFELVRRLDVLLALGRPVVVGFSRKSSLGRFLGDPDATTGTTAASVGAAVAAYERGASILRVHDVRETVEALTVAAEMLR